MHRVVVPEKFYIPLFEETEGHHGFKILDSGKNHIHKQLLYELVTAIQRSDE